MPTERATSRIITITTAAGLSLGCGGLLGGEPIITNPPAPEPSATLIVNPDGSCEVDVRFDCPPPEEGTTCNPPEPMPMDCPALSTTEVFARTSEGACTASGTFDCPPDLSCPSNTPIPAGCPPQLGEADTIQAHHPYGCLKMTGSARELTADCPPELQRPLDPSYRIEASDDGTCTAWFTGETRCPEGASCNPPPPISVPCPPQ